MNNESSLDDDTSCNRLLSDDEIPRLRSSRKKCQTEIDAINARIDELVQQRWVFEDQLRRYDALLAPIKRIPLEILSHIFDLAADEGSHGDGQGEWKLPTVLPSRVCKAWRKMAVEVPKLWCTVRVVLPQHPRASGQYNECPERLGKAERMWDGYVQSLLDVLPLWIERSKECPLFVTLKLSTINRMARSGWGGEDVPIAAIPLYKALVHLACSVSRRWREVDLDVATSYPEIVEELLALRPEDVPQLGRISFQIEDRHCAHEGEAEFHPDGILAATSLRSATIVHFDRRWNQLPLPWSRLTELRLGVGASWSSVGLETRSVIEKALGPRGVVTPLSVCPELERFEGAVFTAGNEDPGDWVVPTTTSTTTASLTWDHTMVVRLAKLKEVTFHGEEPWEGVMAALDLPSLQSLEFMASLVGGTVRASRIVLSQRFMHAIGRFGSQLRKVRFNFLLLLEGEGLVAGCLRSLQNLRDLQLDSGPIKFQEAGGATPSSFETASRLLLELLTPGEGQGEVGEQVICPRLERFACTLRMKGFTEGQLLRFITKRTRSSEREAQALSELKEVDVYFSRPQEMDVRSELESRGVSLSHLKLRIGYPPWFY